MNRQQALRLAIRSLEYMRARYRVDAESVFGADSPKVKSASKMVTELNQAITILQKELEAHSIYPRQVIK